MAENKELSMSRVALNYGLITGGIMILVSLILYVLDLSTNQYLGYINYVVLLAGIAYGTIVYRDAGLGGYISYGKALGTGFLIGLFATIISSVYTYLFFKYFDPGMLLVLEQNAEEKILENPEITDEQLEMALSMSKRFLTPGWITFWALIGNTFMSLILALLAGIFTKKGDKSSLIQE